MKKRLSVINSSSENNFADVSTKCSSHHQGESEGGANKILLFIATHYWKWRRCEQNITIYSHTLL